VKRQVIDTEATVREVAVPAVTRKVRVPIVAEQAKVETDAVPEQYGTVSKTVKVADATVEWRGILCEVNTTPAKVREIEEALKKAGFNPGVTDGIVNQSTMTALNAYQRANNLPVDRYINLATVKALGVAAK
jgi:peptidoglycan hydrolase-like protein with peptidoglycan-binding domain